MLATTNNEAVTAYAHEIGEHVATEDGFEDAYRGEWASEMEYTRHLLGATATRADMLDLFSAHCFTAPASHGGLFVFSCHPDK